MVSTTNNMYLLKVILLTFSIATIIYSQENLPKIKCIQGLEWGMSEKEVMKLVKKAKLVQKGTLVVEKSTMMNNECIIFYDFNSKDQLCSITINFKLNHTNLNLYIDDFNSVHNKLYKKYGIPYFDKRYKWKGNLFKDSPDNYGLAICTGELEISSTWKFNDGIIALGLTGDNYQIFSHLFYINTSLREKEEETNEY